MSKPSIQLRLYVAGDAPNSHAARATLNTVLRTVGRDDIEVEVCDVFAHPEAATRDGVLVTPMLIRVQPEPRLVIVGNLGDGSRLRGWLELEQTG